MNARSLFGLALVSCAIVLTGWGAVNLAGPTLENDEPAVSRSEAPDANLAAADLNAPPAVPERIASPPPQKAVSRTGDRTLATLLFSPEFLAPPPKPGEAAAANGLETAPPVEQVSLTPDGNPAPEDPKAGSEAKRSNNDGRATSSKPRRDTFRGPFTAAHVDRIKRRLNLTAEQEELWRPVEAALKRILARQKGDGDATLLSATESQDLYWTAGPLIMSLRPDQREEARNLARSMGLESVASLL